jgi:hypothetical protein
VHHEQYVVLLTKLEQSLEEAVRRAYLPEATRLMYAANLESVEREIEARMTPKRPA